MLQTSSEASFADQLGRLYDITGTRTQVELAAILGIRQSSVSDAKRRGTIPADWLLTLLRFMSASPEWIITGNGARFVTIVQAPADGTPEAPRGETTFAEALRRIPTRVLTDELLRRIDASEAAKA